MIADFKYLFNVAKLCVNLFRNWAMKIILHYFTGERFLKLIYLKYPNLANSGNFLKKVFWFYVSFVARFQCKHFNEQMCARTYGFYVLILDFVIYQSFHPSHVKNPAGSAVLRSATTSQWPYRQQGGDGWSCWKYGRFEKVFIVQMISLLV